MDDRLSALSCPVAAVHLWTMRQEPRPQDEDASRLQPDDVSRAAGLGDRDRGRLLARRALLRCAVATLAGCRADALVPRDTAGPRCWTGPKGATWFASSSTSGDDGLLAVAREPVGIDLEARPAPPDAEQVSRHLLADPEHQWICADAALLGERFLAVWVRKEAVVKCTGDGLSRSLRSFVVDASVPASPVRDALGRMSGITTVGLVLPRHEAALAVGTWA